MLLIDSIRKHASAWYTKVFLGLLALCFVVLWGGGDLLRQGFMGDGQTVLTIGGKTTSTREFSIELQRALHGFEAKTGQRITMEEAKKIGLVSQVLRGIIQKTLLDLESERLGLVVTDETIRKITHENPMFHNQTGEFQQDRFNQFLQAINVNEARYVTEIRGDLRRSQLISPFTAGLNPPKSLVDRLYKWQHEKRKVKIIAIPAKSIQKVNDPKEEDLKTFYENNPSQIFTSPERRTLTALIFGSKNVKVEVSAEKISEVYNSRKETDFAGKSLMQVSKEIEKELSQSQREKHLDDLRTQIEDMEASGASLKEIAEKFKLDLMTLQSVDAQGNLKDSKEKISDVKLKDLIIKTGFSTDSEEVSETIETPTGDYLLVRVDEVLASHKIPYEKNKAQIKTKWVEARKLVQADENAKVLAEKITKEGEKTLKGYSLKTVTLDRQGNEESMKLGIAPDFIGRIFTLDPTRKALHLTSTAEPGALVIVLEKVISAENTKVEDKKKFEERIRSMLVNDIIEQYLVTLENRYKVEVNKHALNTF